MRKPVWPSEAVMQMLRVIVGDGLLFIQCIEENWVVVWKCCDQQR